MLRAQAIREAEELLLIEPLHKTANVALLLALGTAQLVAWGTMYYAIAVLGRPIRDELGLTERELFGAFTWSLVLSGVLAPSAGRLVDRMGGRFVLAASSAVGACGFAVLATSHTFLAFFAAWTLLGVAMALGLYDTCFAALAQVAPVNYRRSVTAVTLLGGLASTVAWPASHYLQREISWRGTSLAYAGALLASALLYLVFLPNAPALARDLQRTTGTRVKSPAHKRAAARNLAFAFAGAAFIAGALSAHLINTLIGLEVPHERAVWIASTVGVLQVVGRLIEGAFAQRNTALRVGLVTFGLFATSTLILLCAGFAPWLVYPFAVLYGTANGLLTIAKAAIPVELLGFEEVGALLGRFSAPSLLSRAVAPFGFALLTNRVGLSGALVAMSLVGMGSFGAYVQATRARAA